MSIIEVHQLEKTYGDFHAVRNVSFAVEQGECVGILGPNGAGKSTTIEILEGFRQRDSGTVHVLGVDPAQGDAGWRARLGIVLQECGFESYLTVREVLALHARYYPSPRSVDEVLDICQLTEKSGSRVLRLSGGQRRKLDVALAIIGNPEVIFLDEPTTGFDPLARKAFWSVITRLRALGSTVILTTHFLEEAEALADRLVLIVDGSVATSGTIGEIRSLGVGAEVRFRFPPGLDAEQKLKLGTVCTKLRAKLDTTGECVVPTREPTLVLAHLTSCAAQLRVELPSIRVNRPSLEDVYLGLVDQHGKQRATEHSR
jgi:ABC-2 type transport system ATP-binding protein